MKFSYSKAALTLSLVLGLTGCSKDVEPSTVIQPLSPAINEAAEIWPQLNIAVKPDPVVEQKVADILATMTLEQKVAQMIQPEIRDITVEDMRQYGFGSYLNGGGAFPQDNKHATPQDWIKLAEDMYQASIDASLDGSTIPTMWGTDAVHGHNNVIGATLFPHNIGLGAANNPALIEKIATATATEVMATGIDWVFAPTVAVVRDDRWGRTYEGYSEDPEIVRAYAAAIVNGLQGRVGENFLDDQHVISTVKHFIGDGGTEGGDDQGNNIASEEELFNIHAQGYVGGLSAGAQSVMATFNSWHGDKTHGNKYLLTDVLKDRMGFDGFVVGDWNGHGQVAGCTNESCPQSVNAGLDIYMVPTAAWKPLYENTIAQVNSGIIPLSRIDDAVSRILRVKIRAGLFEKPSPAQRPFSGKLELIGAQEHRDIARQAVRESLVLLKNKNNLLPLSPKLHVLVAGDGADNIGKQSGGWTITWQGTDNDNADFPGGSSIYQGIEQTVLAAGGQVQLSEEGSFSKKPDVAIVVFGEEPYAEGNGDLDNLEYQRGNKSDLALLKQLKAQGIPTVALFISGRPLWVNPELNASDAFVAAWLPGSEGEGIAEVIFSQPDGEINNDFAGRLSFSWPATPTQTSVNRFDQNYQPLLPYGYGLKYGEESLLPDDLNETVTIVTNDQQPNIIFEGTVKAPWKLSIANNSTNQTMNSNTLKLDGISIRTIDRVVQEDARQIVWDGSQQGTVALYHDFPEDFRQYIESSSALTIDLQVNSAITEPVYLSMNCQPECAKNIDITPLLSQPQGQWQTVSIDLNCFKQNGIDIAKVFTPFALTTTGKLNLSISRVALIPDASSTAQMICQ